MVLHSDAMNERSHLITEIPVALCKGLCGSIHALLAVTSQKARSNCSPVMTSPIGASTDFSILGIVSD